MATIDDLAVFSAGQGLGAVGTSIFKRAMPERPDRLLVFYQYGGEAPEYTQSASSPAYQNPHVQVAARDMKAEDAEALSYQAWSALAGITNAILSGTRYLSVRPNSEPLVLRRDTNDRTIYVFNLTIKKEAVLV